MFASGPRHVDPLPSWDRECQYFSPEDDVSAIRQAEDDEALARLQASGQRLSFWASQYRLPTGGRRARFRARLQRGGSAADSVSGAAVVAEVRAAVEAIGLRRWFIPLGVSHRDHQYTSDGALAVARSLPDREWIVYEDLPYARESQPEVTAARNRVAAAGFRLEEIDPGAVTDIDSKREAVSAYRSQLRGLGRRAEIAIAGPERYYALRDLPLDAKRGEPSA